MAVRLGVASVFASQPARLQVYRQPALVGDVVQPVSELVLVTLENTPSGSRMSNRSNAERTYLGQIGHYDRLDEERAIRAVRMKEMAERHLKLDPIQSQG